MATFCVHCGSPIGENAAFCGKCGTPATPSRPTPASAAAPLAPAAKGSSALKIVVILLCCLFVGGIVVVGAVAYVAHRVKQAVVQKAAENGVDLNSLSTTSEPTRALPKPCTLLSKDEVSRLIGQPIERAEIKFQTCEYYGPAGLSAKLAQQEGSNVMERAKTQGTDPKMSAMEVQRMLNQIGAASGNTEAGPTGSNGELPLLVLSVSPNGKATMNGLNIAKVLVGAASKANSGQPDDPKNNAVADVFVGASVEGLGDKAMWTPKSGLYVLQGDTLIQVNPGVFPDFNTKCVAVARAVLPKV